MAAQQDQIPGHLTLPGFEEPEPAETSCDVCGKPLSLAELATLTLTVTVRDRGQANRRYETHRLCIPELLTILATVLVELAAGK